MRLDLYLFENGFAKSRTYAADMIKEGRVFVNNKAILKPSYDVSDQVVTVSSKDVEYVSRGGYKLVEALRDFHITAENKCVADIGASTGGFSDVVLKQNAKKVYAIDVGTLQLDLSLRNNDRLINMENTNALDLTSDMFDQNVDLVVMDVSFVSIKSLLPHLIHLFNQAEFVVLIKPQFEAGKKFVGKGGIVKDKKVHVNVLLDIYHFLIAQNCHVFGMTLSKTKGKDGNQEYFVYFSKQFLHHEYDPKKVINLCK